MNWKKGRGKLGVFNPLMGNWQAEAESEMGPVKCKREFKRVLSGKYIQLAANWEYPNGSYDELAMIGINRDKEIWLFGISRGKSIYGGDLIRQNVDSLRDQGKGVGTKL